MKSKIQEDTNLQHTLWPIVIVGWLLLSSLGLELLAHQVFGQIDLGTLLRALYLSFWSFVLGTAGFLLLAVRWWLDLQISPVAMNRLSSESKSSHFVKSKFEVPIHIPHQDEIAAYPCRSSRNCEDGNEIDGRMKVA